MHNVYKKNKTSYTFNNYLGQLIIEKEIMEMVRGEATS